MDIRIESREGFAICGYVVETNLEKHESDVEKLREDYFASGREAALTELSGYQPGYYGLEWYSDDGGSCYYLFGKAVERTESLPSGTVLREIPAADYAVAKVPAGADLAEAWNDLFFFGISVLGYEPSPGLELHFEYYPTNPDGECELWVPIVQV